MRSGMTPRPEDAGASSLLGEQQLVADADADRRPVGEGCGHAGTVSRPRSFRRAIEAPNAPTPGSITCEAAAIPASPSATRGSSAEATEGGLHRGESWRCRWGRSGPQAMVIDRADRGNCRPAAHRIVVDRVRADREIPSVGQLRWCLRVHSFLERGRSSPRVQGDERRLGWATRGCQVILQARDQAVLPCHLRCMLVPLAGRRAPPRRSGWALDGRACSDRADRRATTRQGIADEITGIDLRPLINERYPRRPGAHGPQGRVDIALDERWPGARAGSHHDRLAGHELPAARPDAVPSVERFERPRQFLCFRACPS